MKVVRWMGAFGRSDHSLYAALSFELASCNREVAAEPIKHRSYIDHARVGLLVSRKAVKKVFSGDVWSQNENGKLVKTRKPIGNHSEAFCSPDYVAIVVKGNNNFSLEILADIKKISKEYKLPIIYFDNNGNWKEVY